MDTPHFASLFLWIVVLGNALMFLNIFVVLKQETVIKLWPIKIPIEKK